MAEPIETNKMYAQLLGWSPCDFGANAVDAKLVEAVSVAQGRLGVEVDGVCGPTTYGAWLRDAQVQLAGNRAQSADWLADAGRLAVFEAKRAWLMNVLDPPTPDASYAKSRESIDLMIRSDQGLKWDWEPPYIKDGNFEWCGAFAAFAWRGAGLQLAARKPFFASTYRLDRWAQYIAFETTANPKPAAGPFRKWKELDEHSGPLDVFFSDGDGPRAGDILLVGGAKTDYGKHVTVVESYDSASGVFTTIEGNGTGALPNGRTVQGVIRGRRTVGLPHGAAATSYHARRLIRPALNDLI